MRVLTLNAGSSSIKCALYEWREGDAEAKLVSSQNLKANEDPVQTLKRYVDAADAGVHAPEQRGHAESSTALPSEAPKVAAPGPGDHPPIRLVVHRVVHGGPLFHHPTLLTPDVIGKIESLNALAPLHNPPALRWIAAAQKAFPPSASGSSASGVQHVACFDTAFFFDLPAVAREYALPRHLVEKHQIRRYGFHGIAHAAMCRQMERRSRLKGKSGGRLITMQLGSGASCAAILNGRAVDTTMGHTPLEGLVMSTRTGDLDPALLPFLQKAEPSLRDPEALEHMLYHEGGLAGLSGWTGDMKTLEESDKPNAQLACEVFSRRLLKYVGAFVAVLGGLDCLVFGGGIGEHAAQVRKRLVDALAQFMPVKLDEEVNRTVKGTQRISTDDSQIEVWVVAVDEAEMMVEEALKLTEPAGWKSSL